MLAPALAPGKMTLRNTIVVLNTASSSGADINRTGSGTTINACNALSSYSAWSNASADGVVNYVYDETLPLFKDAANGDYTLADGSQAINKGNDAYAVDANGQKLTLDATGKPRFNGTVDLGAYEYGVVETASLTVTTTLDVVDAYDGKISLREAIRYAASNATLGDAITFAASLKGATIKLSGAQLEISQAGLTVDATSLYDAATQTPGIAIDADGKSRVFSINGSATLVGLTLRNGVAEAGGGVYVARGAALTMRQ